MSSEEAKKQEENVSRGLENPRVIDLILEDKTVGGVVLSMIENRSWNGQGESAGLEQLHQLEEKFNNYLDYVLDGWLAKQYPQYREKPVKIVLESKEPLSDKALKLCEEMKRFAAGVKLEFIVQQG